MMNYAMILGMCLSLQQAMGQQPAATSAAATTSSATANPGKITGEKKDKSYTTRDGKTTYVVGETIQIGMGSGEDKSFQYIKSHVSSNKFVKSLLSPEASSLDKEYEDTQFTVTDIYEGVSNANDMLVKDAPKTVFIVFQTTKGNFWDVAIEKALKTKEVERN